MVGSGTGSGKFDRIRIREKGPDLTGSGSGSATLGRLVLELNIPLSRLGNGLLSTVRNLHLPSDQLKVHPRFLIASFAACE